MDQSPYFHIRNIGLDLLWTLLSCGLFNVYVQYRQMQAMNAMLKEARYSFTRWSIYCTLTCGLYLVYHEYRASRDVATTVGISSPLEPIAAMVLTLCGFNLIADAIRQSHINKFYGSNQI